VNLPVLLTAVLIHFSPTGHPPVVVDSPAYRNKTWRDSAALYQGRVEQYRQTAYSYDWGMTFAMLPVAGEAYVDKTSTGIRFFAARVLMGAMSAVGAVRLIGGSAHTGLNIGLLLGGLAGYVILKLWEISDVLHTVSHQNEAFAENFHIATPDLIPGSIRYPTRSWPDWVTKAPEPRHPERAREAVDRPLPAFQQTR
jgi:hypothetical protein